MQSVQSPTTIIQELTIDAPISVVTLLEDRAQVKRIGKIQLNEGLWRLTIPKVAPVIYNKSLRAEFCQEYPGANINDVRVHRKKLIKQADRPDEIQALETDIRTLIANLQHITEDRQHLESCFERVNIILVKYLAELPVDAVWGQLDPKSWREQIFTLFKQIRDLRSEVLNSYHTQQDLSHKFSKLNNQLRILSSPNLFYQAHIEADLTIEQSGEYEIAFDYVVPNALWRPWHQARLLLGEKNLLSFRFDGCVWQRTGEDWQNVDLIFSTARTSLGNEPPLLTDERLNVKEKSKQIIIQTREQKVQTTGLGTAQSSSDREVPATVNLPGVDDGGEVRNLRSSKKATIPSDGRPYRIPIVSFESEANIEYVLMPEVDCQVILKSEQINTSQFPILAGPVDLVRTSEFVGRTSLLFIAPGEKFALGWGPDPAMRVQRTETQERKTDHLTEWNIVTTTVKLFLSNIGAESRIIKTTERVPISELEQVKIEVIKDKTTNDVEPDKNGFCNWDFNLNAYSQLEASLVYQISTAPEVKGI
ncbi:MAG TPA: mucoidy inhibitor MuiA family protein [Leptolyngbyaceae cyanobacterium]